MSPLPIHRPQNLTLGPLETEIVKIIWGLEIATTKQIHDHILSDPDRELAYASVTTVLQRLTRKGWVTCDKTHKAFVWRPLISSQDAHLLEAHDQLNRFLAVGNPDVVAAFADSLDTASLEKLEAIAHRLQAIRKAREDKSSCI